MTPLLYIAVFAATLALGRRIRLNIEPALSASVYLVVFTVGFWGASVIAGRAAASLLGKALLYLALTTLYTVALGLAAEGREKEWRGGGEAPVPWRIWLVVVSGFLTGSVLKAPSTVPLGRLIDGEVLALISLAGLDTARRVEIDVFRKSLAVTVKSCVIALAAGALAAASASVIIGTPLRVSLLYTWGMGWYSFSGPFAASHIGVEEGLSIFIVNLLREQLVFLLVPLLRRPFIGLLALGGATTMDNTLPIYVAVYGEEAAIPSVSNGVALTLVTPFLLAAALSL